MRTIPAVLLGAVLATGLLSACSSSTGSQTPAVTTSAAATGSASPSATASEPAAATPTQSATAPATPVVMQPSALTLDVTDGAVTGRLVVAGSDQGVGDAEVSLVFRPADGSAVQVSTVTTDATGAFTATAQGATAGAWTASFLGTDAAGAAVATAQVG